MVYILIASSWDITLDEEEEEDFFALVVKRWLKDWVLDFLVDLLDELEGFVFLLSIGRSSG